MAQPTLCIDTDIVIDFLRTRGSQKSLFETAIERYACAIPAIAAYEISFGIERYGHPHDITRFQRVLEAVEVLPFDLAAARASAQLDAALQKTGVRLGFPDVFIAGICVARSLPLLTRNLAHFARIPQLRLLQPDQLLPHST